MEEILKTDIAITMIFPAIALEQVFAFIGGYIMRYETTVAE